MKNVVAIYSRLSEEDRNKLNKADDSRSIQNQKSMLISYALSQGWEIYNIYSDDDYKGSDRNRPAFTQLMKDAADRKFDIVLCKSQARFTRELELVEKIIHGQFVEWGIRFIGYADNADTAIAGNKKARQINGLVNEWYLEDLSDNIRTVLTDHRKKGMHIGAFALYGYKKDPEQKGHLIIDEEAAEVVRLVFELYASGMGKVNIARYLNERGIPNPTEYKRRQGLRYKGADRKYGTLWKYYAISDMIRNEMYIGNMVQGKYKNPTYKSKSSKPVPRDQWIIVEGTHEPIIEKDLWDKVQQMIACRAKPMCTGEIGLFAGKTRCMYCGYTLRATKQREFRYLRCTSKFFKEEACKGAFIPQRFLEKAILDELNQIISQYFDEKSAEENLSIYQKHEAEQKKLQRDAAVYQKKIKELENAVRNSYLDRTNGIITMQEFMDFKTNFQTDIAAYKDKLMIAEQRLASLQEQEADGTKSVKDILKKYKNIEHLDRTIVDALIDYIEIGRNDHKIHKTDLPPIVIHWKF
ncbi:MAG: recombinase family protein [Blautia sp.]|nr:recombinase family protein [Lachnoclostridium sp.]MCM1210930.1 recombinase family protein [Blautia sp.]